MDHSNDDSQREPLNGNSAVLPAAIVPDLERLLGQFRPFLKALAEAELPRELQAKLDPSDLVQETLLRGFRSYDQNRGSTERELRAWLSEILRNYLADVRRGFQRGIRDVRRERPLVDVACPKSPAASEVARQSETQARLQHAMAQMSEEYRMVLQLRQQQGLTFPEIGAQMNRSADAVRMLWGRAAFQLGKLLRQHEG